MINNDISNDFKICPNCGKKFTKAEYIKNKKPWGTKNQVDSWWKRKKYCCYQCGTEHSAKSKHIPKISTNKYPLEFTTTVQIWEVEKGKVKDIIVQLYDEDIIFRKIP